MNSDCVYKNQSFSPFLYNQNSTVHMWKERLVKSCSIYYWEQLFLLCWACTACFKTCLVALACLFLYNTIIDQYLSCFCPNKMIKAKQTGLLKQNKHTHTHRFICIILVLKYTDRWLGPHLMLANWTEHEKHKNMNWAWETAERNK